MKTKSSLESRICICLGLFCEQVFPKYNCKDDIVKATLHRAWQHPNSEKDHNKSSLFKCNCKCKVK